MGEVTEVLGRKLGGAVDSEVGQFRSLKQQAHVSRTAIDEMHPRLRGCRREGRCLQADDGTEYRCEGTQYGCQGKTRTAGLSRLGAACVNQLEGRWGDGGGRDIGTFRRT